MGAICNTMTDKDEEILDELEKEQSKDERISELEDRVKELEMQWDTEKMKRKDKEEICYELLLHMYFRPPKPAKMNKADSKIE
jgi:hypothetical protein